VLVCLLAEDAIIVELSGVCRGSEIGTIKDVPALRVLQKVLVNIKHVDIERALLVFTVVNDKARMGISAIGVVLIAIVVKPRTFHFYRLC
jgi:hypothetical protein